MAVNSSTAASTGPKHPKGLWVLFLTEMWERFGYYLMLGIFSLFMLDSWENGGMGFSGAEKSDIYGTYIGLVYLTPFIGGLLADRVLGYRLSIIIGGLLMSAGYFGLSLHGTTTFYVSLLFIIVGNGFFKPNISTLVGNLYNDPRYKSNKDAGFNIFYMGINVGAFICNFVAAYMRINFGWGYAFAAAGVGMLIGLIVFVVGTKHVKEADVIKPTKPGDMALWKIFATVLLPMFGFGVIGYFLKGVTGPDNPNGYLISSDTTDAFLFGCIPVIAFFLFMLFRANEEDKRPIGALLAVYTCIIVFWAVFHQNGDALTVWLRFDGDRVAEVTFQGVGCAISKASASLMTQAVKGRTRAEAAEIFDTVHRLVTGNDVDADTTKALGQLRALGGVSKFPMRVKCASLAWHALKSAMEGEAPEVAVHTGAP